MMVVRGQGAGQTRFLAVMSSGEAVVGNSQSCRQQQFELSATANHGGT